MNNWQSVMAFVVRMEKIFDQFSCEIFHNHAQFEIWAQFYKVAFSICRIIPHDCSKTALANYGSV
ncbi:hypothetical protein NSQ61_06215 [Aeribacillus sp. FSL K6-1121]|uniref:hypothetical protein n=1 Tax=Aeribacillus sp. FSL K6-1121 TaxID=2954745 RepID=UPI0030F8141E